MSEKKIMIVDDDKIFLAELKDLLLSSGYRGEVKILGRGEIAVPVRLKGIRVSKSAKMKIEKAGGVVM